jgi:hypothetical protein
MMCFLPHFGHTHSTLLLSWSITVSGSSLMIAREGFVTDFFEALRLADGIKTLHGCSR